MRESEKSKVRLTNHDLLWVAVLGAFEGAKYGVQRSVAGGFVFFDGFGFAGDLGYGCGETGTAPGGEDAPGEDAVGAPQGRVRAVRREQTFECGMELFGGFEREA